MKPNILIVQPPNVGSEKQIDQFCERLTSRYYVYLLRPRSAFREDSAKGVRFLNHSLKRLPFFTHLETVITIGESEVKDLMKSQYPESGHSFWQPVTDHQFEERFEVAMLEKQIVKGNFRKAATLAPTKAKSA